MGYSLTEYGVKYYAATDDLLISADTETTDNTWPTTYVLLKEIEILERIVSSEFRVKWDIKSDVLNNIVNSKLYINDIDTGDSFSDNTGAYQTATFDESGIQEGDKLRIYAACLTPVTTVFIRNFRIYGAETIGIVNLD